MPKSVVPTSRVRVQCSSSQSSRHSDSTVAASSRVVRPERHEAAVHPPDRRASGVQVQGPRRRVSIGSGTSARVAFIAVLIVGLRLSGVRCRIRLEPGRCRRRAGPRSTLVRPAVDLARPRSTIERPQSARIAAAGRGSRRAVAAERSIVAQSRCRSRGMLVERDRARGSRSPRTARQPRGRLKVDTVIRCNGRGSSARTSSSP